MSENLHGPDGTEWELIRAVAPGQQAFWQLIHLLNGPVGEYDFTSLAYTLIIIERGFTP
jgi:hypothetical protein